MNKEVGILSLSYGNYVSLEDYMKLQNNWNELKERLKEEQKICSAHDNRIGFNFIELVLDKMQEIESRK